MEKGGNVEILFQLENIFFPEKWGVGQFSNKAQLAGLSELKANLASS